VVSGRAASLTAVTIPWSNAAPPPADSAATAARIRNLCGGHTMGPRKSRGRRGTNGGDQISLARAHDISRLLFAINPCAVMSVWQWAAAHPSSRASHRARDGGAAQRLPEIERSAGAGQGKNTSPARPSRGSGERNCLLAEAGSPVNTISVSALWAPLGPTFGAGADLRLSDRSRAGRTHVGHCAFAQIEA